jgi:branched-chain amino acid transport system permease protein
MPCGEYFTSYGKRMGLVRWRIQRIALLALIVPLVLPFVIEYIPLLSMTLLVQIYIVGIAIIGLNIIVGYAGELMLAQGAGMGIGAYTTVNMLEFGIGLLPAIVVGGLLTSFLSVFAGLPALRVKGYYVAITTLVFQFLIEWVLTNPELFWLTGGDQQTLSLEQPLVGNAIPLVAGERSFYYFVLLALLVTMYLVFNLSRSSQGRFMRGVHENDLAAEVLGINVFQTKLLAFVAGGFFIGAAGGLWVTHVGFADSSHYNFVVTLDHYVILIFGGLGRIWGALIGTGVILPFEALLFEYIPIALDMIPFSLAAGGIRLIIFGVLVIVVLIVEPKGLLAALGQLKEYLRRWPYPY